MSKSAQDQSKEADLEEQIDLDIHPSWSVANNNLDRSEYVDFNAWPRELSPAYIEWERSGFDRKTGMHQRPLMKVGGWTMRIEKNPNTGTWKAVAMPRIGDFVWDTAGIRLVHWACLDEAIEEAEAAIKLIESTPDGWVCTKTDTFGKHRWINFDETYAIEISQCDRNMNEYRYYYLEIVRNPFGGSFEANRQRVNDEKLRRDDVIDLTVDFLGRLDGQDPETAFED